MIEWHNSRIAKFEVMTRVREIIGLVIFLMCAEINAQNLVPNPSFEEGSGNYCEFMLWADEFDFFVYPWECPTAGTSDIFATGINQTCWAAMPGAPGGVYRRIGSQLPRSGNRFAGFYVFNPNNYREYLHTRFVTPLVPGKTYCAKMFVSLADRVPKATNNLGMYFGTSRIRIYTTPPNADFFITNLNASPQILEKNVIQDSISWVKVYGSLLADSAYTHLTIGNFFSQENTEFIDQPGKGNDYPGRSYYFVDDVSVEEMRNDPFTYDGSTTICEGSAVRVSLIGDLEEIVWTTLDDTLTVIMTGSYLNTVPKTSTFYRIKAKDCKVTVKDTLEVKVIPFSKPYLGKDTVICEGATLTLHAGDRAQYLWQDNSTNSTFEVTEPGKFQVAVTDASGCSGTSPFINVSMLSQPQSHLENVQVVCDTYPTWDVEWDESTYLWSTGSTEPTYTPVASGKYWVTVENRCGTISDTTQVYSHEDIFIPNVLTLNDDGLNEKFTILGLGTESKPQLRIVNRWGKEIAMRTNYAGDWPSDQEQESLPSGVYYFSVTYPGCRSYRGWLHILR